MNRIGTPIETPKGDLVLIKNHGSVRFRVTKRDGRYIHVVPEVGGAELIIEDKKGDLIVETVEYGPMPNVYYLVEGDEVEAPGKFQIEGFKEDGSPILKPVGEADNEEPYKFYREDAGIFDEGKVSWDSRGTKENNPFFNRMYVEVDEE